MKHCKADILRYRLPLKQPLFLKHSCLSEREGLILRLSIGHRYGYGEIAPLPGWLFSNSRLLCNQQVDQGLKQAFASSANIMQKLKKAKVKG
ncbi:hypothetical protein [Endozoicomonas atrinae]|uniref:hypothetical protein n=1 Tax=Endozoicomonas atrinae TaxID=1333660 RepID=UPI003B0065BD